MPGAQISNGCTGRQLTTASQESGFCDTPLLSRACAVAVPTWHAVCVWRVAVCHGHASSCIAWQRHHRVICGSSSNSINTSTARHINNINGHSPITKTAQQRHACVLVHALQLAGSLWDSTCSGICVYADVRIAAACCPAKAANGSRYPLPHLRPSSPAAVPWAASLQLAACSAAQHTSKATTTPWQGSSELPSTQRALLAGWVVC